MDASGLVVPLGFTGTSGRRSSSQRLQSACSTSQPTALTAWGFGDDDSGDDDKQAKADKSRYGAAMGCSDGSIFLFHPDKYACRWSKRRSARSSDLSSLTTSLSIPHRYPHHLSGNSRASSPTTSKANLTASSSKSRAISGLSKEKVEAPKNYVDFEDEQEKLKEMVNDRGSKERGFMDGLISQFDRTPIPKPSVQQQQQLNTQKENVRRRSVDLRSIPSLDVNAHTLSPTSSPSSPISTSPPPPDVTLAYSKSQKLTLYSQILLARFGEGHGVADIKVVCEGELMFTLQQSGYDN